MATEKIVAGTLRRSALISFWSEPGKSKPAPFTKIVRKKIVKGCDTQNPRTEPVHFFTAST
jgi:hypothetical protein